MKLYRLKVQRLARRQIKAVLPEDLRQEIVDAIKALPDDPYLPNSRLEDNLSDRYRLQINGWRILYKIDEQDKVVTVLTVRKRTRNTYLNVP